jgi:hypothetical protein
MHSDNVKETMHFPYPYGFAILYGSTETNDMITDLLLHKKFASCTVEFHDFTDILSYAQDT